MVSLSAPRSTGPLVLRLASSPRPALVQEPGAPDEPGAVDQRIELSGRVTVNWAAKFAGLLGAEGIGAGDAVALDLPVHWLSHALALGVLCAEAEPALEGDSPAAVLTDRPEAWPDPSAAVFAVALPRGLDPEFDGPAAEFEVTNGRFHGLAAASTVQILFIVISQFPAGQTATPFRAWQRR